MEIKTIDGATFRKMFLAGAKCLEAKKEWINELNVFPVPDGDTGTNMTLTIMSAAKEVNQLDEKHLTLEALAKAISGGSLRGARGNSGVILSQLFRGFAKEIQSSEVITAQELAKACARATETAYKAVIKPKEGTILTVARGMSEKAEELVQTTDDLVVMIEEIIKEGDYVLSQTSEMLPVLKQAGVVDSGGQGLMTVIKGAYDAFMGKEMDLTIEDSLPRANAMVDSSAETEIKFGYCTEFIVNTEHPFHAAKENEFKSYLESIGDSIVVVSDDNIVKVHVHTNDPGLAIQKGLSYGYLTNMKIDNMRQEHHEKVVKDAERKEAQKKQEKQQPKKVNGFIAVAMGEGMSDIFEGLGIDCIIQGGQTMNPSTEDILDAVEKVNAEHVYVLPNNKNIILAANQAAKLTKDKEVIVIPSKTIPQGITAMISFESDASVEQNQKQMTEAMEFVKTGQVTYAIRDIEIDGKTIKEGDIMGIGDDGILAVGEDIEETTIEMIKNMVEEDSELITIYYGSSVNEDDAKLIAQQIEVEFEDLEVEVHFGGQPIYYYFVSVE